ncbi:tetraspanin-3-like [Dioscorea cayenensis subsp. rotundata]|uniref:Tetraspanin-3-like n=1 Tax=Dioscorea cayennensis subsp. rotundata TaxID=55577 RepID=A0AB40CEA4_DIOCR|nr:tetraspanin-3-like [Dioscorea cayenensis subsp. rotundata]XP_039136709.1 tetraspanin-3-like [Dioscorea cayenensis subsp. rotundata]
MLKGSNGLIGIVNFVTFLISIPILGGGIWLSSRANSTECLRFLQWPLIIIGVTVMVISLMGFAGACYKLTWLMWLYLFAMFFVVAALLGFIVFAFAVTDRGHGEVVVSRKFLEYQLSDYSGWLKERVSDPQYWSKISSCLRDAKVCKGMARYVRDPATGMIVQESSDMFSQRDLSPIESGCCKPPTSCGFVYRNETYWDQSSTMMLGDPDCTRWSNDQQQLCYQCDSCKAGVLASIRHSWRKVSVINIIMLIILVIFYVVGCAAFRNNRRIDNSEPYSESRMTKTRPSRFQF